MAPRDASLFWATWSLSEAPVALRERIKPLASRMRQYFMGYQARYGEVNNVDYFTNHWIALRL